MSTIVSCIKRNSIKVFRRLYIKRRLQSGEYETDWQLIPNKYFKTWGKVTFSLDDLKPNYYNQDGFNFSIFNNDGLFSDQNNLDSMFSGYLTRFRSLVKVQAGYTLDGVEYPTASTLYIGLISDDIKCKSDNIIDFQTKHLSSVFMEYPADRITGLGTTQTASTIIGKIRDHVDTNAVAIFQKYISTTAWIISTTSYNYNMATSTALQNVSTWELMQKLAEAENYLLYVSPDEKLYFISRAAISTTADFHFSGIGDTDRTYGHNVMQQISINDGIRKIYNRIKVKYGQDDTTTSYYIRNESWTWGDSSSSFRFGVREYNYDNDWLSTTTAQTVGDLLYTEYSEPKQEIELDTKFVPHLSLNQYVSLTYKTKKYGEGSSYLWNHFLWGYGIWNKGYGYNINIDNAGFRIMSLSHDINNFKSSVKLREI